MFKKTLIAMSLAAVTGSAMADVAVSGRVEQTFTKTDSATAATDQWIGGTDNNIVFNVTEDLGNGLTAFAKVALDVDATDATGTAAHTHTVTNLTDGASQTSSSAASTSAAPTEQSDMIVGIKGSFGTVMAGHFEAFVEGKLASTMSMNGHTAIEQSSTNAGRTDNGVAYISPTVNGIHVGIGGYATADETEAFDAKEIAVFYANGPLSVSVAQQKLNDTLAGTGLARKTTALAASYTMGDAKVSYLRMSNNDVDGVDSDDNSYRLDYTMGANKVTVGHLDDESNTSATAAANDITSIELTHNFSKRTQVYIGMTDQDTANSDTTYLGMQHSF